MIKITIQQNQEEPGARNQRRTNTSKIMNQEEPLRTKVKEDKHNEGHKPIRTTKN